MKGIYTEQQRKDLTLKEYNRLVSELAKHHDDQALERNSQYSFLMALFAELAFLTVTLSECKQLIQRDGLFDEYRNSETQYGRKKSIAVETYDRYIGNYLKTLQMIEKAAPGGLALRSESFGLEFL